MELKLKKYNKNKKLFFDSASLVPCFSRFRFHVLGTRSGSHFPYFRYQIFRFRKLVNSGSVVPFPYFRDNHKSLLNIQFNAKRSLYFLINNLQQLNTLIFRYLYLFSCFLRYFKLVVVF